MSADAREAVLARVRAALATPGTHHARADGPPATGAGLAVPTDRAEILDLFTLRVEDYRAVVDRVHEGDLGAAVARALATHGATSAVAPNGLDAGWFEPARAAGVTVSGQDEVTTVQIASAPVDPAVDAAVDAAVGGRNAASGDERTVTDGRHSRDDGGRDQVSSDVPDPTRTAAADETVGSYIENGHESTTADSSER